MAQNSTDTSDELDALIIRNLRDLEGASHRLVHKIEPRVAKAIDGIVKNWASREGWKGEFDFSSDGLWLAPQNWSGKAAAPNGYLARYYLDYGSGDDGKGEPAEDYFWLTRLCCVGKGKMGFRWYFGNELTTKPKWKKIIQEDANKRVESIGRKGFEPEDSGYFFTQIKVDAEQIALGAIDNSFDKALQPVRAALDRLLEAKPMFDELMQAAEGR